MSISSQKLLRNTSETFDDLKDSAVVSETDNEEFITERSMTSMSNECLPDPSNIDIPDTHSGKYFLLFFFFNNTYSFDNFRCAKQYGHSQSEKTFFMT